jgi:leucyl aminopeptidase
MAKKAKSAATTKSRRQSRSTTRKQQLFEWNLSGWLDSASLSQKAAEKKARVYFLGASANIKEFERSLGENFPKWQRAELKESREIIRLTSDEGPVWVLRPRRDEHGATRDRGLLANGVFAAARDLAGRWVHEVDQIGLESVGFVFWGADEAEMQGAMVGLELAAYSYKKACASDKMTTAKLFLAGPDRKTFDQAKSMAKAVNIARHLVNTPGNKLNPVTYADAVRQLFQPYEAVKCEVWDEKRLSREKMNLIKAVGQAATEPPRLVKLSYRPKGRPQQKQPLAFVGKGITFDSGGLDIKPAQGMRLMKKDMGGSAALVGFLHWLVETQQKVAVDVYLPMAENAIAGNAFRPGDVFEARNGHRVEIHNTDAEGRLILADALSLANEAKAGSAPSAIISVATLTGAAKIGLGADIAAFYATDDELAQAVESGAQSYGDWVWRLPLFEGYRSLLKSSVADTSHCAATPYAGSITAALFLSDFVDFDQRPYVHFDIYAWNDKAKGALREPGGSGQTVQGLIGFLNEYLTK